ncbi:hypothetical protein AVEN_39634-1 [Araneus ventricosus]|uniref:Uncharacterized protein n=1 Tax=Araneus ventricosus TaxID=182803 RepID=A0A4Y2PK39_ARAVE|nr:hypothetical protein AVEN_39634-1 [Araneus ventricosus]
MESGTVVPTSSPHYELLQQPPISEGTTSSSEVGPKITPPLLTSVTRACYYRQPLSMNSLNPRCEDSHSSYNSKCFFSLQTRRSENVDMSSIQGEYLDYNSHLCILRERK